MRSCGPADDHAGVRRRGPPVRWPGGASERCRVGAGRPTMHASRTGCACGSQELPNTSGIRHASGHAAVLESCPRQRTADHGSHPPACVNQGGTTFLRVFGNSTDIGSIEFPPLPREYRTADSNGAKRANQTSRSASLSLPQRLACLPRLPRGIPHPPAGGGRGPRSHVSRHPGPARACSACQRSTVAGKWSARSIPIAA